MYGQEWNKRLLPDQELCTQCQRLKWWQHMWYNSVIGVITWSSLWWSTVMLQNPCLLHRPKRQVEWGCAELPPCIFQVSDGGTEPCNASKNAVLHLAYCLLGGGWTDRFHLLSSTIIASLHSSGNQCGDSATCWICLFLLCTPELGMSSGTHRAYCYPDLSQNSTNHLTSISPCSDCWATVAFWVSRSQCQFRASVQYFTKVLIISFS